MAIKEGDFIRLSYTGTVNGSVFDTTEEEAAKTAGIHSPNATYGPVTICVGQKHVITGLDEELVGKKVGASGEIVVPPAKAFGERDPKRMQSFPKNMFKEKPVRGMPVKMEEHGEGTVVDVIGARVIVDFNPQLAGQTLTYSYKIEEKVSDALDQLRGLVRLYAGRDMEIAMDDGKVTVTRDHEGSIPSSIPTASAATEMPTYAPMAAATARRVERIGDPAASSRYVP